MSHLTTELCEKYPGERIPQWEYDLEAREWASVGFVPTAFAEGKRLRLPKSCYFSQSATKTDVLRAWSRIKSQLRRNVKLECTIGISFGMDLEAVHTQPSGSPKAPMQAHPPTMPLEQVLSNAFNKLFRPLASR